MKKRIAAILLALSMLVSAASFGCSGDKAAGSETEAEIVTISADRLADYIVVRAEDADEILTKCGMEVRSALENGGVFLKLTTDFFKEGIESFKINRYEILVGETNREETAEFLDSLMPWQYGYALVGEKIVIAGHDSESTRAAVDCFIADITTRDTMYYSSADDYIHGEILEGVGREYTAATVDAGTASADDISALAAENEILIIKNAPKDKVDSYTFPEGKECGAKISSGSGYTLFVYDTEVFAFSSYGSMPMRKGTGLTAAQKGTISYAVFRCNENLAKFVFAEGNIPSGNAEDAMKTVSEFLGNCSPLPVIVSLSSSDKERESVESVMTDAEFADARVMAKEKTGESTDIFVSQTQIAVKSIDSDSSSCGIEKIVFQKTEE